MHVERGDAEDDVEEVFVFEGELGDGELEHFDGVVAWGDGFAGKEGPEVHPAEVGRGEGAGGCLDGWGGRTNQG